MKCTSELGETYLKVVAVLAVIGCIAIAGIFLNSDSTSQTDADEIVNSVILVAKQAKEQLDAQRQLEDQEENTAEERPALPSYKIEHEKYTFTVVEALSPELIKVDTGKEQISSGVCRALKKKFNEPLWPNIFKKVLIIDHAGKESSNIIIFDCPRKSVPSLRFYVHFKEEAQAQVETQPEQTDDVPQQAPQAAPVAPRPTTTSSSSSSYSSTRKAETSSYSPKTTCPIGTSPTGKGGLAKSGCKCMGSGEEWNGTNCELKNCPGNKVLQDGKCLCPEHLVQETGVPDSCVECNLDLDCSSGHKCVNKNCVNSQDNQTDCRWGVCQTCDTSGSRQNLEKNAECETSGLPGACNGNGICYPTQGKQCASLAQCPVGSFCNYGGTLNSSKRQKGVFGQTPNVCQIVSPLRFTYKDTVYYYNSEKDLKSWCRAANNKPNCKWGYLAKPGAESWCASLGKRLLTKAEIADVWSELRQVLPKTYTGYAYWISEGVWLENQTGKIGFIKGRPDGYGGRGGVVCK